MAPACPECQTAIDPAAVQKMADGTAFFLLALAFATAVPLLLWVIIGALPPWLSIPLLVLAVGAVVWGLERQWRRRKARWACPACGTSWEVNA